MEALFRQILEIGITAGFVVLGVVLIRLLCKKAPKWIVVALWGLVGLRLLLPFSLESPVSMIPEVSLPSVSEPYFPQALSESQPTAPQESEADVPHVGGIVTDGAQTPTVSATEAQAATLSIAQVASAVWLFGVAAMLWYAAMTYIGVWRRVRTATKDECGVYRSEAVGSPFILGVFRPRIYVPYSMDGERIKAVLAHERAHIKRGDHIIKPLGFLLLSVYWFQPLLWVAYALLCRDIELACDERVVKALGAQERRDYSMALVTSAVGRRRIAACPLCFGEVAVKERVKNVMNYKKPALWIVIAAVILSAVAAVCLLTDPLACKEQPYGSFAGAELKFYRGEYLCTDTLYLDDDLDELSASMTIQDSGVYGFAVKDINERDMTVTVQCNRDVWLDGECVKSFTVPYDEDVTLHLSETADETSWTIGVSLALKSEKDERKWYLDDESQTMTMYRYVSGDMALYLYGGYFSLVEQDTGMTSLDEPLGNYQYSSGWQAVPLSINNYFPEARITEGRYEWVDDTLVLTQDGDLARYVFKVEKDRATLKNIKGEMCRHKTSDAPILENRRTFSCEYMVTARRTSDIPKDIAYTISDLSGKHSFSGESNVNDLMITSLGNGQVMITREDPSEDGYFEEHEWIDLAKGESLGVRGSGLSNHAALGHVGYAPSITQADGKVFVTAYYISWCGTGNPSPIMYELEGLSGLQNGTVTAAVNEDEIVIDYTDDSGERHVMAYLLDQEKTAVTRPLIVTNGNTADASSVTYTDENGVLKYSQIAAAYVRAGDAYVEIKAALADGSLTFEALETLMTQAVTDGEATKTVYNNGYRVNMINANSYHRLEIVKDADGEYTVEIGYLVTLPEIDEAMKTMLGLPDEPDGNIYF